MNNRIGKYMRKFRNTKNALLISMLVGSLIGAAVTLLYAPQTGAQTRAQIHMRIMQLRERAQMEQVFAALAARESASEAD
jgi:gas vesicle protein